MIRLNNVDMPSTINQTGDKIGTYHLAETSNLYEIQRSNTFEFVVTGLNNILRAGAIGSETNATFPNAEEIIRLSVSQAFIPHFTQEVISVRRGNSVMKFAGTPTFESGEVTCIDYIGADTKAVLQAWQNQSYNVQTEKVGLVSDYKKDCYLIEYTPDWQQVRQWVLKGCWISGLSEDQYSSDNGADKRSIKITIQYDKAYIDTSELK